MEPRAIKRPEDKPGNLKEIYRRWFELLKKQVEECTYSDSGKANLVEMNKRHLYGMLELMNAEGAISDKEREKLCSEVDRICSNDSEVHVCLLRMGIPEETYPGGYLKGHRQDPAATEAERAAV